LIQWDTGIKANRARDYIRAEVQLRSANANGGIDAAADNLRKVGTLSKVLKGTGYVGLAIEGGTTFVNAHAAYSKGDIKGGNIEVGKGVGGIAAGVGAGALVSLLLFGVATGGVGLVVIGVATVGAGYLGGEVGKWGGEKVAQQFNELTQPWS